MATSHRLFRLNAQRESNVRTVDLLSAHGSEYGENDRHDDDGKVHLIGRCCTMSHLAISVREGARKCLH